MDPMFTKLNNDLENVYGIYNTKRNSKKHEKQNLSYRKTRDRKSTRLNSSHSQQSRMPSSA